MFELKRHPNPHEPHHVVIGGGFSGLYLAWRLRQAGVWVRVYEAGRFGGMIQTRNTAYGPVETAANGFMATASLEHLAKDLEIPLQKPKASAKARYIHSLQGFERWPLSVVSTLIFAVRVLWMMITRQFAPRPTETMTEWGERTLGRKATDRLLRPGTQGIYALPADQLSASLIAGRFFQKKKKKHPRSKFKGTVSFPRGMGQMIEALMQRLNEDPGVDLIQKRIHADDLKTFSADPAVKMIWLAVPPTVGAKLVENLEPKLSEALAQVKRQPVVTATAFFTRDARDREGFGYLKHPELGGEVMGVLFNDRIFAGRSDEHRSETYILNGAGPSNLQQASDEDIRELIAKTRAQDSGRALPVLHLEIQRWPDGLPRYDRDLEKIQPEFRKEWGKIRLVGNYVAGIGLTRIMEWVDDQFEGLKI